MGKFGGDSWTDLGERLAEFADVNRLHIVNTFFEKPPSHRWTFQSTDAGKTRHTLDCGLASDRFPIINVECLNRFDVGSDH